MTAVSSPVSESKAFARASCSFAGSSRTFCMARSNNFVMIYPSHHYYVSQRSAVVSGVEVPLFILSILFCSQFIEHGIDVAALEAVTGRGGERVERGGDVFARAAARPEQRAA